MVAKRIDSFGGMYPATDDRLLAENAAARSENTWLYSGALSGINSLTEVHTCSLASTAKVYRIPSGSPSSDYFSDSTWLEFGDIDTDVFRSPTFGDTYDRYYWTSPTGTPTYNTLARIKAGDGAWKLGVPAPGTAPTFSSITGGSSSVTVTRSYVMTWVTAYGEEGPPSPAVTSTGKIDDTWSLSLPATAVDDRGAVGDDRYITKLRVYRTVTSSTGTATFFLVAEQTYSTLTYADSATDATVSANAQLASTLWTAPPSDLKGWVAGANGMIVGFRGNEIWFSEPYRPHAWPAVYALTVEYPIVGLGAVGQNIVVCTEGFPIVVTATHPASATQAKLATFEPCLARGSILSTPDGVYYASQNGLVLVANGTATNITREMVTRDEWQSFTKTQTLRAGKLGFAYYAYGTALLGVFQADAWVSAATQAEDFLGAYNGVLIDPNHDRVAFNVLRRTGVTVNITNDVWSGELFVLLNDNKVYWINLADTAPTPEVWLWRSKIFQTSLKKNLEALRIYFSVPPGVSITLGTRNTDLVQTLQANQYGLVRIYADGTLVMTRELRTSGELMRIPSGFKADFWQIEVEGRVNVYSLQWATSAKELASV